MTMTIDTKKSATKTTAPKLKAREDVYQDERAFWTSAEVSRIDLSSPLTPVIVRAVDPPRVWPERRYTLDLRAPISRAVRSAEDRKRLKLEFAPTFEALKQEALRLHRVVVTCQVIDPADPRIDDALACVADLVERVTGRGEQITEEDLALLNRMRLSLSDIPWGSPNDDDKEALATTRADVGRALGAALGALFDAVQLAHAIRTPFVLEHRNSPRPFHWEAEPKPVDLVERPFDWNAEPGVEEAFVHCRKRAERWLAVVRRLHG